MSGAERALDCPSAQPDMDDARVLGVVERAGAGTEAEARLTYVADRVPVDDALLEAAGPVPPTLLVRFAAPCQTASCRHFARGACQLATRIAEGMAPVVDAPPACAIRPTCRWHAQEGEAACRRCPQVVTRIDAPDAALERVALG